MTTSNPPCPAALSIMGEHFPCQQMEQMLPGSTDHNGWAHSNRDAEALWIDDSRWTPLEKKAALEELVFQALGAASVCWDSLEKTGVFNSDRAKALGDHIIEWINKNYDKKEAPSG